MLWDVVAVLYRRKGVIYLLLRISPSSDTFIGFPSQLCFFLTLVALFLSKNGRILIRLHPCRHQTFPRIFSRLENKMSCRLIKSAGGWCCCGVSSFYFRFSSTFPTVVPSRRVLPAWLCWVPTSRSSWSTPSFWSSPTRPSQWLNRNSEQRPPTQLCSCLLYFPRNIENLSFDLSREYPKCNLRRSFYQGPCGTVSHFSVKRGSFQELAGP